jgi:hypothetical protein
MATTKVWWKSKIVWTSVGVILLGLIPLANEFLKVVAPSALVIVDAVLTFVAGVIILICRVITDNPIDPIAK